MVSQFNFMEKLPLINIEKFEKRLGLNSLPPNGETFWYGTHATWHYQRKNNQVEGIQIRWNGNPFGLDYNYDYILEKNKRINK